MEKWIEYAAKLTDHLSEIFHEEALNHIDINELNEGDNLTHFFQAVANAMPTKVYNAFTKEDLSNLDFNHIANKLCFQYCKMENSEDS